MQCMERMEEMIKRAGTLKVDVHQNRFGGQGEVRMTHLLQGDEFYGKGRLFSRNVILPGSSIGFHPHEKDMEAYYILSGEGIFNDNGVEHPVKAGDVAFTAVGQSHSLRNNGDKNLELIALILFA